VGDAPSTALLTLRAIIHRLVPASIDAPLSVVEAALRYAFRKSAAFLCFPGTLREVVARRANENWPVTPPCTAVVQHLPQSASTRGYLTLEPIVSHRPAHNQPFEGP